VRPQDILPDGADTTTLDGKTARKGSVAAFVANARIFEQLPQAGTDASAVLDELRTLLPTLQAVGVFDVFELRSSELKAALGAEDQASGR
jgi:hypothetical protein